MVKLPRAGILATAVASFQQPFSTPVVANGEKKLVYFAENMGDRSEEWIAAIENGVETARYNVRYIATIHWAHAAAINTRSSVKEATGGNEP